MDIKKHIQSIIEDIIENKDIANIFLKVQVLAHLLRDDQFSQWFKSEQSGYKDCLLPEYRIIRVSVHGSGTGSVHYKDIILPTSHIENKEILNRLTTYRCKDSLSKIQEMAQIGDKLCILLPAEYINILQPGIENCDLYKIWLKPQYADLTNIVEQAKSTLLQFLLELNDSLDLNIELNSSSNKKQIEKAMNNTIYAANVTLGNNSTINANNSTIVGGKENTLTISNETKKEIEDLVTKIEVLANEVDDDRTDIADAILSIREELSHKIPRPRFLKTAFNSLKAVGIGVLANKITPLVDSALEIINKN